MTEPTIIEGWVWCEVEGTVHADVPDPDERGPIYPVETNEEGWHKLTDHADFPGTYLHYICPGPHHQLRRVT